ncbi:hypothetical protein BDZ89DRAFT_189014 [Hymenopellis radicata]|nr:hypothetical protein BDZ89DRAFT_189014 [Hymenopellis radicata]
MPSSSRSLVLKYRYYAFIADWLCTLLFAIATGIDDDAEIIDFMFSPDYGAVYSGIFELVCLPYQTPFTLFQIIVFSCKLYSRLTRLLAPAEFGATHVVEEFLMNLKIFYLMTLQAMGEVRLSDMEQVYISGLTSLSEYRFMKQNLTNVVTSPHTGTIEIGHDEWETYLVDISRLSVPMPYGDADMHEIQATIDALLQYMQFTSSMGNLPLSELVFQPFPYHSHAVLPPFVFDVSPLLLDIDIVTDLVSLSVPSTSFMIPDFPGYFYPSSHSLFAALSTSLEWNPSWNPSADPIVDSGRRRTTNIAPGSAQAVYDIDGISSNPMNLVNLVHGPGLLRLHQPRPKRVISVELLELEASVQEDSAAPVLVTESRMTKTRETVIERRHMLLMNGL